MRSGIRWSLCHPSLDTVGIDEGFLGRATGNAWKGSCGWRARPGTRWKDLPRQYGSPATVWRRLRKWQEDGTLLRAWQRLLGMIEEDT
jgi:transposase